MPNYNNDIYKFFITVSPWMVNKFVDLYSYQCSTPYAINLR